ncbi:anti-sigma factor domain-containing protein [Microbacterium invictum]|uniref:Anti-sigma-K factor RskA n=1 Tax=Microbacterium invictum TaxID=515415 RepID=A0AA40SLR8_9MICO|nr:MULTISPECIES: anti-sigma factor [Microbacterium]MBB4138459.1 anti-sigma-K factor RskA [Microbacterium invictum]
MAAQPDDPSVEPAPNTEALQTIQRRNWTRTIVGVVGAMVLLVGLGWIAGTIMNTFALTPEERALADVRDAADSLTATAEGEDDVRAAVTWSAALGTAVLDASGLPDVTAEEEIAVWYVQGDEYDRADRFRPIDGSATVILSELWPDGAVIELSVDPVGGGSSGEPLAAPLLTIEP